MVVRIRLLAVLVAAVALAVPMTSVASAAPPRTVDVIVVLHDGVDARQAAHDMARSHDAQIGFVYEYALTGFSAEVPEGRLAGLERDARVSYVDENLPVHAVEDGYPTGVSRIDGVGAHDVSATGAGLRAAVIDTGIDLDHPDLPNVDAASGSNCITPGASADDDQGHGTHVAGTIAAADNGKQVIGVAPAATVVPIKVLDSGGSGSWESVICGIDKVTQLNADGDSGNDIDVANMSLGGSGSHDGTTCAQWSDSGETPSTSMFEALCRAMAEGAVFTVAAGNDGTDASKFVPAAYPDVITVSAYADRDGTAEDIGCTGRGYWKTCDEEFASFSNDGEIVDVMAPGVSIESTTMDGKTGSKSGTSMAAPHVAGVVALVLEQAPSLSPAGVAARLLDTGQCPDTYVNAGAGTCVNQGTWHRDGDSITEPMVNALWAATNHTGDTTSGENTAPVAQDDTATTTVDTAVVIDVLANDNDSDGDTLTVTDVDAASNGSTSTDGAKVTYTPASGYSGSDSFSYTVSDGNGGTDTAIVNVTISSDDSGTGGETNDGSMHVSDLDSVSINDGGTWTAEVTITVSEPEGNPVEGAEVSVLWGGDVSGSDVCTTTAGQCTVSFSGIHKRNGSVSLTVDSVDSVDSVSGDGLTYVAGDNSDPDGDSNGTTIVVSKP